MRNRACMKNGVILFGCALLSALAVCLEMLVLFAEMAVYGVSFTKDFSRSIIHWGIVCIVWGLSFAGIRRMAKIQGCDILERKKKPGHISCFLIILVIIAGIVYMSSSWDFQFKPFVEWMNMQSRFGNNGVWAFLFQYLYYLVETLLITAIISFGQNAGESLFSGKQTRRVPWGALVCAMTWGFLHGFSKDWNTALLCAGLSAMFGAVYVLSEKNFRYTYLASALIFML